ncbi:MAG TPA: hypothetical protein VM182_10275 [Terriglobia bacterium]|nr:hypothetical protein [Terriglobia bacterium]
MREKVWFIIHNQFGKITIESGPIDTEEAAIEIYKEMEARKGTGKVGYEVAATVWG